MIHVCFISVRKPQEDEIGMFIAYQKRECLLRQMYDFQKIILLSYIKK